MKPFIRWPGSKGRYVKELVHHVPLSYNTYIEPFVGSGAFFLFMCPTKWIINDTNQDLIEVWRTIRDKPEYVLRYIHSAK